LGWHRLTVTVLKMVALEIAATRSLGGERARLGEC